MSRCESHQCLLVRLLCDARQPLYHVDAILSGVGDEHTRARDVEPIQHDGAADLDQTNELALMCEHLPRGSKQAGVCARLSGSGQRWRARGCDGGTR